MFQTKLKSLLACAALTAVLTLVSNLALAADEHPDFTGVWEAYASSAGAGRGGANTELTEEAITMRDAFVAQYGDDYVEPGAFCVPPGLPATMMSMVSYPVEIIHSKDRVTMLAEYDMQVRRIFMDGRGHPDDLPPTRMGHSIGHWEGDELVIETTLLGEYLLGGWPRTEQTIVEERIYRTTRQEAGVEASGFVQAGESDDVLVFEYTVTDPVLYKEPRQVTMYYQRIPEDAFLEYDCPADLWRRALSGELSYE